MCSLLGRTARLFQCRTFGTGTRLNKLLNLSRRSADVAIREGRVTVNGVIADGRTPVQIGSEVRLDGVVQRWQKQEEAKKIPCTSPEFVYLKYWKPLGVTCTSDVKDRTNIISIGGFDKFSQHIHSVGRLDKYSTGLILLTSDGRVSETLLKPANKKEKRYVVELTQPPTDDDIDALRKGVIIATSNPRRRHTNVHVAPTIACSVKRINSAASNVLEFILREGRHHQIRKMCDARGLKVGALSLPRPCDWDFIQLLRFRISLILAITDMLVQNYRSLVLLSQSYPLHSTVLRFVSFTVLTSLESPCAV